MNATNQNRWNFSLIWKNLKRPLLIIFILIVLIGVIWVVVNMGYPAPWTGFDQTPIDDPNHYQPRKLLWDWLELLIIPIVLLIAGWGYSEWQKGMEYKLAKEKEHSDALQAYFDSMKDLIIDGKLTDTQNDPDHPIRALARSKTITTLQIVDDERKKAIFNFLWHAGLIVLNQPVILFDELELNNIDFRNMKLTYVDLRSIVIKSADLTGATINNSNLYLADLRFAKAKHCTINDSVLDNAILTAADMRDSNLYATRFIGSHLQNVKFNNSILTRSLFNGADLRETDFSEANLDFSDFSNIDDTDLEKTKIKNTKFKKAHLQNTRFHCVDFRQGVDFTDAILDHADFREANITYGDISKAKSKRGVIMPDGKVLDVGQLD